MRRKNFFISSNVTICNCFFVNIFAVIRRPKNRFSNYQEAVEPVNCLNNYFNNTLKFTNYQVVNIEEYFYPINSLNYCSGFQSYLVYSHISKKKKKIYIT